MTDIEGQLRDLCYYQGTVTHCSNASQDGLRFHAQDRRDAKRDEIVADHLRLQDQVAALLEACKLTLSEWFDRVYPPDIFIGGPKSDPGVNEVRRIAERLRAVVSATEDCDQ